VVAFSFPGNDWGSKRIVSAWDFHLAPVVVPPRHDPFIKWMTTNPSPLRKAGIHDYETFPRDILQSFTNKPILFEVFSNKFPEMRRQR